MIFEQGFIVHPQGYMDIMPAHQRDLRDFVCTITDSGKVKTLCSMVYHPFAYSCISG